MGVCVWVGGGCVCDHVSCVPFGSVVCAPLCSPIYVPVTTERYATDELDSARHSERRAFDTSVDTGHVPLHDAEYAQCICTYIFGYIFI